jgi:hypothetical protein
LKTPVERPNPGRQPPGSLAGDQGFQAGPHQGHFLADSGGFPGTHEEVFVENQRRPHAYQYA